MNLKKYLFGARNEEDVPVAHSSATEQASGSVAMPVMSAKRDIVPPHIFSAPPMESWRSELNAQYRDVLSSSRTNRSKHPLAGRYIHHRLIMLNELLTDADQFAQERMITAEEEGRSSVHILTNNHDTIPFDRESVMHLQQIARNATIKLLIVGMQDPNGLWKQAAAAIPGIQVEHLTLADDSTPFANFITASPHSYMMTEAVPVMRKRRIDYDSEVSTRIAFNDPEGTDSLQVAFSQAWDKAKDQHMRRD